MKKRVLITAVAFCLLLVASVFAAEPGTEADPLITRSYVENVVYPATRFQVVEVPANKSVIFEAGTEAILRMGSCTVIGTAKGGISDVTMGYDLPDGTVVQGNHHLICPLSDGRGLKTSSLCLIMIKGGYTIK